MSNFNFMQFLVEKLFFNKHENRYERPVTPPLSHVPNDKNTIKPVAPADKQSAPADKPVASTNKPGHHDSNTSTLSRGDATVKPSAPAITNPSIITPIKSSSAIPAAENKNVRATDVILAEAIKCIGRWDETGKKKLQELTEEFIAGYPEHRAEIDQIITWNTEFNKLTQQAFNVGSGSKNPNAISELLKQAGKMNLPETVATSLVIEINKNYERGIVTKERRRSSRETLKTASGVTIPPVTPRPNQYVPLEMLPPSKKSGKIVINPPEGMHPNDIRALSPAPKWTLLLDETGTEFGGSSRDGKPGKFVGLLVRKEDSGLPPLKNGWHAVDCKKFTEISQVVQSVLDAPCGIIGLTVKALPETADERWLDGMLAIVDWVLRLLPLNGKTEINVLIEGRMPFPPKIQAQVAARDALHRMGRIWPKRAKQISLNIQTIGKDDHFFNGYVDALAYCWGADMAKGIIKASGLRGTCLLDVDAGAMANFWDHWDRSGGIQPGEWAELVSSPDATVKSGLLNTLLKALADECRKSPENVLPYLEETRSHLNSKAINLYRLAAQIEWIQSAIPDTVSLSPALRMVWLTVKLARANHLGQTENSWQHELEKLVTRLFDEDAPLVCHAELLLAVNATNKFDFQTAKKIVERWQDVPKAVPGLCYWGQATSLMGQCFAFMDNNLEAAKYFDRALAAFSNLSDADAAANESSQTLCYRIIAAMDSPGVSDDEINSFWEKYLFALGHQNQLTEVIAKIAESSRDKYKYAHHLFLRQLVFRGNKQAWKSYLDGMESWQVGEGHPWQLIQLYRAILIHNIKPEIAKKLALEAADIAFSANMGPTVKLTGAVCRSVAVAFGSPWPESAIVLDELKTALPLAKERIDFLNKWLSAPANDPRQMIKHVLPFNFR